MAITAATSSRPFLVRLLRGVALLAVLAPWLGPVRAGLAAEGDCIGLPGEPLPFAAAGAAAGEPSSLNLGPATPRRVSLEGRGFAYRYAVDGQQQVIRGMGYNPRYAGLAAQERRALYGRDFSAMSEVGVNTVFGWDPAEFDGLTLDLAEQHGLGVALPYDFDFHLSYADPATREQVAADVLSWVERWRWHPAVRLWAIGNETFHKLVPPSWCLRQPTTAEASNARAFSRFYADLVDRVHALDPHHPILYRESEDAYVEWMRSGLRGGAARPWLMYGLNVYTPRLAAVLDSWPARSFDQPLLVSEFGPAPESRPDGYREYWELIRRNPAAVLGGAVYVWFADGPEPIDRQYGLVDSLGRPVDGSLEVVRQLFQTEQ